MGSPNNIIISGEELAWQRLERANAEGLCKNACLSFNKQEQFYIIRCLGNEFKVSLKERLITGISERSQVLLNNLSYFLKLSMLWYMLHAKDIGFSGRLVNPVNIKGGDIFFKGSHVLPLQGLSNRYSNDLEGFYSRCEDLGGIRTAGGDAASLLYPFARVPITIILWKADEEFGPSADLLFDSTCEMQLPLDVIWSTAMLTILAILKK